MKALTLAFLLICTTALAQIYDTNTVTVTTFAGSAFSGYLDGVGQSTFWSSPTQITSDSSSNLFVWDSGNARIRKISPDGTVTTFAGGGAATLPAVGTNAALALYAFYSMVTITSNVIVVSGFYSGNNVPTFLIIQPNGLISKTNLPNMGNPSGTCIDSVGNIYYTGGNKIYRWLASGGIEVFVGSGNSGAIDGNGIFNSFGSPTLLACDAADNIYVWDGGVRLRRINQNRDVTTPVPSGTTADGSSPRFSSITSMFFDSSGNLIIGNSTCIRKLTVTTNATTFAGSFTGSGYTNGIGSLARFSSAGGVCLNGGSFFVADSGNNRIRQVSFNATTHEVVAANLGIGTFAGITITGAVGRSYQIQSSTDMSAWTTRTTLVLSASPYLWIDQNPVSGNQFYRALLLP